MTTKQMAKALEDPKMCRAVAVRLDARTLDWVRETAAYYSFQHRHPGLEDRTLAEYLAAVGIDEEDDDA